MGEILSNILKVLGIIILGSIILITVFSILWVLTHLATVTSWLIVLGQVI